MRMARAREMITKPTVGGTPRPNSRPLHRALRAPRGCRGGIWPRPLLVEKSGWGLGLSLVERIIVNFHKGKVIIKETKFGKGTTFEISLNKKLNH